ncbi:MAG TPA: hypothetical protein VFY84_10035 [Jiangellales bacterium]|nr:hypothetical protein [Jiangellales bacterium]
MFPDQLVEVVAVDRADQFGEDLASGDLGRGHASTVVVEDLDLAVRRIDLGESMPP